MPRNIFLLNFRCQIVNIKQNFKRESMQEVLMFVIAGRCSLHSSLYTVETVGSLISSKQQRT